MAQSDSSGDWLCLNVGGVEFQVTKQTLRFEANSYLARLCDDGDGGFSPSVDEDGCYRIDRNPKHFGTILDYLRNGKLVWGKSERNLKELLLEAQFYCLDGLVAEIGKVKQELRRVCTRTSINARLHGAENLYYDFSKRKKAEFVTIRFKDHNSVRAELDFWIVVQHEVDDEHFLVDELEARIPEVHIHPSDEIGGMFVVYPHGLVAMEGEPVLDLLLNEVMEILYSHGFVQHERTGDRRDGSVVFKRCT